MERLRGKNEDWTSNNAEIKPEEEMKRERESKKWLDRRADRERNRQSWWRKMRYAVLSGS